MCGVRFNDANLLEFSVHGGSDSEASLDYLFLNELIDLGFHKY